MDVVVTGTEGTWLRTDIGWMAAYSNDSGSIGGGCDVLQCLGSGRRSAAELLDKESADANQRGAGVEWKRM